jgi:hypothetical protein
MWPDLIDRLYTQKTGAVITPCGRYRYLLWRRWDESRDICLFIGHNPSTADATADDPTVRRMVDFARRWGYGELWVANAYAHRATDPKLVRAFGPRAVGPLSNEYIRGTCHHAAMIVAAWGANCDDLRQQSLRKLLEASGKPVHHLGLTKDGQPRHPLYLSGDTEPVVWQ